MTSQQESTPRRKRWAPSLDEWAVAAALLAALLVRLGIIKHVSW